MDSGHDAPGLRAWIDVAVGNAVPVFGVVFLGWSAFQVVTLYVLDGWFCILGLGASVMIRGRGELAALIPMHYGRMRRFLAWVATVAVVEAIISLFALAPGIAVLAHMEAHPGAALVRTFATMSGWAAVATLAVSHGLRIGRGARGEGEGVMALDPKAQMSLYAGRMGLMMAFGWLAEAGIFSGFLVPVYVVLVAALFTYTDLYPRRFLTRVMGERPTPSDSGEAPPTQPRRRTGPNLRK